MSGEIVPLAAIILICTLILGCGKEGVENLPGNITQVNGQQANDEEDSTMKLTSNMFSEGERIPDKYTCRGLDMNPPLMIEGVPEGAKSLALIVDDPDAPVGLWTHWMVKDIRPELKLIAEQSVPGVEVTNSAGRKSYHGPCPPSGTHRYYFKLYALDVASMRASTKAEFYQEVEKHKIAVASLMGRYSKD